jgi:hypothetical protein
VFFKGSGEVITVILEKSNVSHEMTTPVPVFYLQVTALFVGGDLSC